MKAEKENTVNQFYCNEIKRCCDWLSKATQFIKDWYADGHRRKPVVYIIGKITGVPDGNKKQFFDAAFCLRRVGFEVQTPYQLSQKVGVDHNGPSLIGLELKRVVLAELDYVVYQSDLLIALGDWRDSPGAAIEALLAKYFNKPVYDANTFERLADIEAMSGKVFLPSPDPGTLAPGSNTASNRAEVTTPSENNGCDLANSNPCDGRRDSRPWRVPANQLPAAEGSQNKNKNEISRY